MSTHASRRRAASLMTYALLVGLISVLGIQAIAGSGQGSLQLFNRVGMALGGVTATVGAPLPAPTPTPATCLGHAQGGATTDGLYTIDPDGSGGAAPFQAWCNMSSHGGGWTLVVHAIAGSGAHQNAAAVGSLTSPTQSTAAKLSDAAIVAIPKTLYWGELQTADAIAIFFETAGTAFTSVGSMSNRAAISPSGPFYGPFTDSIHYGPNTYQVGVGNFGSVNAGHDGKGYTYSGGLPCRQGMTGTGSAPWCGAGGNGNLWIR